MFTEKQFEQLINHFTNLNSRLKDISLAIQESGFMAALDAEENKLQQDSQLNLYDCLSKSGCQCGTDSSTD